MPAVAAHEYELHFFSECVQQRASGLSANMDAVGTDKVMLKEGE